MRNWIDRTTFRGSELIYMKWQLLQFETTGTTVAVARRMYVLVLNPTYNSPSMLPPWNFNSKQKSTIQVWTQSCPRQSGEVEQLRAEDFQLIDRSANGTTWHNKSHVSDSSFMPLLHVRFDFQEQCVIFVLFTWTEFKYRINEREEVALQNKHPMKLHAANKGNLRNIQLSHPTRTITPFHRSKSSQPNVADLNIGEGFQNAESFGSLIVWSRIFKTQHLIMEPAGDEKQDIRGQLTAADGTFCSEQCSFILFAQT